MESRFLCIAGSPGPRSSAESSLVVLNDHSRVTRTSAVAGNPTELNARNVSRCKSGVRARASNLSSCMVFEEENCGAREVAKGGNVVERKLLANSDQATGDFVD